MEMLNQPFGSRAYRSWEEIISFQLNGILEDEGLHAFNVALAFWEKHMGGPPHINPSINQILRKSRYSAKY